MQSTTTTRPIVEDRRKRILMIAGASIGNALEFYDFIIYGFFATELAATFFPGRDPTIKLLLTFGTFGVSFLARPIGALWLGGLADRRGRTGAMMLAVAMMTLASLLITIMPGRAAIGLFAPLGILLARLIQGFALGGEFGSSTALMIEHSPGGESLAASWQGTSQNVAGLLASSVAFALSALMPADVFHHGGSGSPSASAPSPARLPCSCAAASKMHPAFSPPARPRRRPKRNRRRSAASR